MYLTNSEKEEFTKLHITLIYYYAKRFFRGLDFDEVVGAATIGFVKALNNYQTDKGNKFTTVAVTYIRNEINRFYRDNTTKKRTAKVSSYDIQLDDGNTILDLLEDEVDDTYDWDYIRFVLSQTLEKEKERDRRVYLLYVKGGGTFATVAQSKGMSTPNVGRIVMKINKSLRKNYWELLDK